MEGLDTQNDPEFISLESVLVRTGIWEKEVTFANPLRLQVYALFKSNESSGKATPVTLLRIKSGSVPFELELRREPDGTKYAVAFTEGKNEAPERLEFNEFRSGIRAIAARNARVYEFDPKLLFRKV